MSVNDFLLDHLTETNQIMIIKCKLSSFCQKVDRIMIFWIAIRKMWKCLQTISNKALAITSVQIWTIANCWNKDCLPLFLMKRNSNQKEAHTSLFTNKVPEMASATKVAFNSVLKITFLQRH